MIAKTKSIEPTDGRGPWKRFICRVCGLIYDEAEGDIDSGLPPGTRFEDIPEDWECPICNVTKAEFEPYRSRATADTSAPAVAHRGEAGIVVIGAGTAGWSAVEALRALDADVPISMVTACRGDLYHKPELSIALTRGATPQTLKREAGIDAAARLRVQLISETYAVGLSPAFGTLRTTRGTLRFTDLIIAHGARSAAPACLPSELCWRINDLRAWSGLYGALSGGPRHVAIIGAGMVGCELAEDLARAGHRVTLIGAQEYPLQPLLPRQAALRLKAGLANVGIDFLGARSIQRVERCPDSGELKLFTTAGEVITADQVVAATGLATEPRLSRSGELAFDGGIIVDPRTMRTSASHVYALGDCVSIGGAPCRYIEPIRGQAEAIANAILGRDHAGYVHKTPVIRLKTRSSPIVLEGCVSAHGNWLVVRDDKEALIMEQWVGKECVAKLAA